MEANPHIEPTTMASHDPNKGLDGRTSRVILASYWPIFNGEPKEMLGFQALMVVMRHLHAFAPYELLKKDIEAEQLRLLKTARTPFVEPDSEFGIIFKQAALSDICPLWRDPTKLDATSFINLVGCEKMNQLFWSRKENLLYGTRVLSKGPNDVRWSESRPPLDAGSVAEGSLIRYDGTIRYKKCINNMFEEMPSAPIGTRVLPLFNKPIVLRVLYTPQPGKTATNIFDEMQFIDILG
ncbi:hypothetical protein M426DRAFT_17880, partial [Hypoxylon sp. CI-4A]